MAEAAGKSQIYAGLQFPTDYVAGAELGRRVAERVIEVAKAEGSAVSPAAPQLSIESLDLLRHTR